jgi:hypothetical protein
VMHTLDLSRNPLQVIAPGLTRMPALRVLNVSHTRLSELPEHLEKLRTLEVLRASHTRLDFEDALCEMPGLRQLELAHSRVSSVPYHVHRMTGLERLHLHGNDLAAVPFSMEPLRHALDQQIPAYLATAPTWMDVLVQEGL